MGWLHNRGESAIDEWEVPRRAGFPARDGRLTVLSSFRTRGLAARSMAGWSFVADYFYRPGNGRIVDNWPVGM
jgi:hypothetical protein